MFGQGVSSLNSRQARLYSPLPEFVCIVTTLAQISGWQRGCFSPHGPAKPGGRATMRPAGEGAMKKSRKKSRKNSRPLMFAASSIWVALILVFFVFRGGGTTPIEPRDAPAGPNLGQKADELAALGEYGAAAERYRAAVDRNTDEGSL